MVQIYSFHLVFALNMSEEDMYINDRINFDFQFAYCRKNRVHFSSPREVGLLCCF